MFYGTALILHGTALYHKVIGQIACRYKEHINIQLHTYMKTNCYYSRCCQSILCPASVAQLTHKMAKSIGCLTQITPLGCLWCKMHRCNCRAVQKAMTALTNSSVTMSDLELRQKGALNVR